MTSYASITDLNTYTQQTVDPAIGQLLLDTASAAIDEKCRKTFQLTRTVEMQYGQGGNVLMLRNYPVQQANSVKIVMPGSLAFNIPISQLLIQPEIGKIVNYTPLMFMTYGYTAVFPLDIPVQVDYSYGPKSDVYGDPGVGDAQFKTYTFTNKNWFLSFPYTVYKNGVPLALSVDYTVDYVNGKVTLTNNGISSDVVTADYSFYSVPNNIKLAALMIATKQLNLPKNSSEMKSAEGDPDYKVQYDIGGAMASIDKEIEALLITSKRKGVW